MGLFGTLADKGRLLRLQKEFQVVERHLSAVSPVDLLNLGIHIRSARHDWTTPAMRRATSDQDELRKACESVRSMALQKLSLTNGKDPLPSGVMAVAAEWIVAAEFETATSRHEGTQKFHCQLVLLSELSVGDTTPGSFERTDYRTFEEWYARYQFVAAQVNPLVAEMESGWPLDSTDEEALQSAYREGQSPDDVAIALVKYTRVTF